MGLDVTSETQKVIVWFSLIMCHLVVEQDMFLYCRIWVRPAKSLQFDGNRNSWGLPEVQLASTDTAE